MIDSLMDGTDEALGILLAVKIALYSLNRAVLFVLVMFQANAQDTNRRSQKPDLDLIQTNPERHSFFTHPEYST